MKRAALAALATSLSVLPAEAQPSPRQPEVVCDLSSVTVATVEDGALRTREEAGRLRLTFREVDPKAGTARATIGEGASGEEFAAVTIDANAISYLVERAGVFKLVVTTATKPSPGGWQAVMSWHGSADGAVTLRTGAGLCRMRAK